MYVPKVTVRILTFNVPKLAVPKKHVPKVNVPKLSCTVSDIPDRPITTVSYAKTAKLMGVGNVGSGPEEPYADRPREKGRNWEGVSSPL